MKALTVRLCGTSGLHAESFRTVDTWNSGDIGVTMDIRVESTKLAEVSADWLIVGLCENDELTGPAAELDGALDGKLTRLREAGDLTGKLADLLAIYDVPKIAAQRLLLVGLGNATGLSVAKLNRAYRTAARHISEKEDINVAVTLPDVADKLESTEVVETLAVATTVGCVGQALYRSEAGRFPLHGVSLIVGSAENQAALHAAAQKGRILGDAVNLTRELVNRMPQEIFPASFAERAAQLADQHGLDCKVFDERQLEQERMGALLAVAAGSERPPRLVVLKHYGGGSDAPTLGLIGKGVTFDSGGLSLKTSDGMKTMKCDMAGAATVLGAMTAIARLGLPVNVVGLMGLVENMPSGSSYKLGDVLTARNGTTIEVLNTDAEGRLVLADVLSYAVDSGIDRMIDLATLTGACVVALGEDVTGVFSNDQGWCDQVLAAACQCGEDAWQMPMFELYTELIKSDVADIKNIGGRWGGAITAAKFLEKFVSDKPWVHLDIAGPSFASSNKPHQEGGASGCMVRTLVETAAEFAATPDSHEA